MSLLAIDLGLRAGLACFGRDGRLRWYRSHNFGSPARLRRAAYGIVREIVDLEVIVAEGDRHLAEPFARLAQKQGLAFRVIGAEAWRRALLLPRQQRSGADAKHHADEAARRVIEASGAPRPTQSLRHDASEAILIGLWAIRELGWPDPLGARDGPAVADNAEISSAAARPRDPSR